VMIEFKIGFLEKVFNVTKIAGDEVIHRNDRVTFLQETIT
jgi:hypothetical protein